MGLGSLGSSGWSAIGDSIFQTINTGLEGKENRSDDRRALSKGRESIHGGTASANALLDPYYRYGSSRMGEEFQIEDDPIYQYQIAEALRATERKMNAMDYSNSGNILAALGDRAVGEAGRYQGDAWNRWNTGIQADMDRGYGAGRTMGSNYMNEGLNIADLYQINRNNKRNTLTRQTNSLSDISSDAANNSQFYGM